MTFVPLNVRSYYSLGFGTASVEELAKRAATLGLSSLALTDIETMAGQVRFHDACRRVDVRPITGVELRRGFGRASVGERSGRIVLLARDEAGYANLCRIVSRRRSRGQNEPLDSLAGSNDGLFVLCHDLATVRRLLASGLVDRPSLRLLHRPGEAQEVSEAAAAGVETLMSPEIVGLGADDLDLHALLLAIRQRVTLDATEPSPGSAVLDQNTLNAFGSVSGAALASQEIADACTFDLPTRESVPPRLPELTGYEAVLELRRRCRAALVEMIPEEPGTEYRGRLEHELAVIERLGFVDYLLAVAEIATGARHAGTPFAARGSVAGSLAAFLLGISEIDPVRSDLLFERFLHEHREAPPDIDLDVASTGRAALREWVSDRFGKDRVAGVAAYQTYRGRSAARAGLAALGVPASKAAQLLRRLDDSEPEAGSERERVERLLADSFIPAVRQHAALVARLVGLPSHIAAHPGGVIIGDRALESLVPLERAAGGQVVSQYDYRSVERAGFLKIDLLGNHFLSEMQESLAGSAEQGIPTDDERTWRMIGEADTVGCFQIESPTVRSVLRRLPMREFADLVAALAIVRPGAAAGAAKEHYVRRARGEEPFEPLELLGEGPFDERFATLRERLQRSNGVILFDEDIIRLLATVGGLDLAQADALRVAIIAAGEDPTSLGDLRRHFLETSLMAGTDQALASRAWDTAARFASYSFAEAHAASYADLAWKAAYLRTHLPLPFGCALINHHRGLYPLRTTAAAIERWGVEIRPPDVNRSAYPSTVEGSAVRVGLGAIKGLTRRAAGDLVGGRPFGDLGELLDRARPAKRELRALLLSGACDGLPPLSPGGYPQVHETVLQGLEGEASPQELKRTIEGVETGPTEGPEAERLRRYQALVRVRNEISYLGMHPSGHPMQLLRAEAERAGCLNASELASQAGGRVRFAGLLAAMRRVPAGEDELRYLTFEDETGLIEAVLLPAANVRLGSRLSTPGPYLVEGTIRRSEGDINMVLSQLKPFHER